MKTPRNRFTVMPFLTAFLAALLYLPATTVVKVNALGMGFEHEEPWRRPSLLQASLDSARSAFAHLRESLTRLHRHTLFRPALVAGAVTVLAYVYPDALWAGGATPVMFGALTEGQHAGEFLMGERGGSGASSRDNITVLSGQNLTAGAVIGRVTRAVGKAAIPAVVGTGNGVMSALFAGPEVQKGNYVVTCTVAAANNGTFSVVNPSGKALPNAVMAAGSVVYRSREINFTITDGATDFIVGDVFTIVVGAGAPTVVGTGNGTISGLSLGPDAKTGQYRVECITAVLNGGTFKVVSPDGDEIAVGSIVAGAGGTLVLANQRQLNLTITDGATDFAVGDFFEVFVYNELAGGKVVAWDPLTYDGRQTARGVLYDNVDASTADLAGVIVARDAAVLKSALQWGAAITAAQKESAYLDLAARGVIAR